LTTEPDSSDQKVINRTIKDASKISHRNKDRVKKTGEKSSRKVKRDL